MAVNTIAEGDTRQVGLEAIIGAGGRHPRCLPQRGSRGLERQTSSRAAFDVRQAIVDGERFPFLDEPVVTSINGAQYRILRACKTGARQPLKALSQDIAFQGSNVLGMGFVLTA